MGYISVDKLSDFEFHDVEFNLESFENNCLIVKAAYLNIHKDAEQNPHKTDMEIASARITFKKFNLRSYESGRTWIKDENGNFYSSEPQIIHFDNEAYCRFKTQLQSGIIVFDLGTKEGDTYFVDAVSEDPFFTVCFSFESVVIEWDNYKKEAWYVSEKG